MQPVYLNTLGIVCALGRGRVDVASRLFNADSSGVIVLDDALISDEPIPFAPVTGILPAIPRHLSHYESRNFALALAALEQIDSEINTAVDRYGHDRVAVVMGTSTSGISEGEALLADTTFRESHQFPSRYDFLQQEIGSTAESIARYYKLAAPAITISTACTSSAKALAVARRFIRLNLADAVIVGGSDSRCALTINGFHSLSALSSTCCRPFSANRDGTVIGEGAAIFLMTRECTGPELAGIGESSDAHNMTAPEPDGKGAMTAMLGALQQAEIDADGLAYVNLHGTGTRLNDAMESRALRGIGAVKTPSSSSKGQIGHTLGAAGAIETAICWLTLEQNPERKLPPHVWDGEADSEAPLPGMVKPGDSMRMASETNVGLCLMSNSYAFGGNNISVVIRGNSVADRSSSHEH